MQPNSLDALTDAPGEIRQVRVGPTLPNRQQAVEIPWSGRAARNRLVHGFNSRNASSRSFNLIRSKLVTLRRERGWRMIGVVSATPNVGKSFVSANLGAALSRDPRFQTYLIDLDLRRGTIKDIFGIEPDTTVVEYLEDSHDDGGALRGYIPEGEELIIIPSSTAEVHSAELLASDRASALFKTMRNSDERNFFVCDLPPVFANDDAAIIMESLDGYVIVAQDGKTTAREIEATVSMLGSDQLGGVVLNKFRGGLVSEGYGIEERYASEYYARSDSD